MLRGSNVPGCLLYVSLLLSRIGLVVISEDVSDNLPRFRNERTLKLQPTRKTNLNEFGSKRFQENVVENEPTENTTENRISETFNAHSGLSAKRLKIGHISTEVQAKRVRRNPEHSFFDEDKIVKLTDIALQQCPYNTFCHRNRTQVPEFRHGYGSCCTNCFCDEQCGDRMDCCWDFLDEMKIKEKHELTCITPVILPANEQLGNEPIHSYLMIDSCHGNASYKCREENTSSMDPLFPTYSPTTSLIYFNKYCASCNGEDHSTPWDMYVTCIDSSSPSGIALIRDLKRKQCRVRFRPPKKANIDKFVCDTEMINTCNLAEGTSEIDINLEKACRLTKAYVNSRNPDGTFRTVTYANIFCKLCNGHLHYPNTPCRIMVDELTRSPTSAKLTTLIDWSLLSDSIASDVTDASEGRVRDNSEERQTHKTCRENEVKHPTKVRISCFSSFFSPFASSESF